MATRWPPNVCSRVSETAGRILTQEMEDTLKMLQENREHLEAVSQALLDKNRLYRKDLEGLLSNTPLNQEENLRPTVQNSPGKR